MEKNTGIIMAVVTLVVGLVIGYQFNQSSQATHMMPNGNMMGNDESMSMDDMMKSMNAELKGKSGDAFDDAFLKEMVIHHEGAVEMAELALINAKHQEIKDLASEIIEAQKKEIAEMKAWQKSWYNK